MQRCHPALSASRTPRRSHRGACRPARRRHLLRRPAAGRVLLLVCLFCLCVCRPSAVRADAATGVSPSAQTADIADRTSPADAPPDHAAESGKTSVIAWTEQDGLAFAELPLPLRDGPGPKLAVVRLPPENFDFVLCAVGRGKHPPLTLRQWVQREGLSAAINASMYLPDGVTSTGYLREGDYANNSKLARRFGAFFVAGPDDAALPAATLIDKEEPDWQERLARYRLVVQNYRLISRDGNILWKPGGPRNAISAVGVDAEGHILFLHCREPLDAYSFAEGLLRLPLHIRLTMYVEGGGQAGLVLRAGSLEREYNGRSAAEFLSTGNIRAALPNVLGARRRPASSGEAEPQPAGLLKKIPVSRQKDFTGDTE